MYLVFDTETTGLPNNRKPAIEFQPYLVQLAFSLYDLDRRPVMELSTLVKLPEGVRIPKEASEVHHITDDMCLSAGIPLRSALALLNHAASLATTTIAHNAGYDLTIIKNSGFRTGYHVELPNIFCTCDAMTDIVQCPPTERMIQFGHGDKFKRPNLNECTQFFFSEDVSGAHDAFVDTNACARIFFELMDRGLL
jgi:DNA polymerase-3 subunit epsilon